MTTELKISGLMWTLWFCYWVYMARNLKKDKKSESRASRLIHVTCLCLTFVLIFCPDFPIAVLSWKVLPDAELIPIAGLVITLSGMSFAIWARNHLGQYWSGRVTLKEGHRLIQTGPYQLVRHPIYTGVLIGLLGSAITRGELSGFLGVVLFTVAYLRKIRIEEKTLLEHFGDEYKLFQQKTTALIPFAPRFGRHTKE